jgi:class 3 adenylate cyclase/tetratricopeptide (TPR) repeat protein
VHVKTCPNCGRDNPDDARFCSNCATPLEASPPAREERKVVTVLFCDLVGSTARAERMDPEDVRALLSGYHERVRAELERHGGTVEKFIGDAVMALFGAPTAHEDDPERAVRAALAVREWASEGTDLQVRVGITTGEVLVSLGASPARGEGMASGDVVNTAARLQSAAAVNGILVDETTHRATERAIEYAGSSPVRAKGKEEPIAVWEPLQARSRFGIDVRQIGRSPLVGRRRELAALQGTLERVVAERQPQLVTLIGVPGIGKSRLVYELFQHADAQPELVTWRQGRSLPYGTGMSFWALGEMVKGQAGVLETDGPEQTAEKLRRMVAGVAEEEDARWFERHLRPLVGLEAGTAVTDDRRAEAFAAWRGFFEALAEQRPLVLVFEDLHFADDGLLDFVDHLVDWASGVPILAVGTARPELLARRPGWGGGKPNALTLSLSALSDEETAHLVHALLDRPVLEARVQEKLLERAGGNPLYAEEFARLLHDRDAAEELPLPETVQGLIAARIDGLPLGEKTLLQDAAVLGKVFWLGAVTELGELERWTAEERLHALNRKEFVRRERRSSVPGELEYAFRHLLVRDVAYGQIPRGTRAEKHRLAGRWIETLGRPEDHAELLAHHYVASLELAEAAGLPTADLTEPARLALKEAGDRAFALNAFKAAARSYERALGLGREDAADRPELMFRFAHALAVMEDERREQALEDARAALVAAGNEELAGQAEALLAEVWWHRGDHDRTLQHLEQAQQLVATAPPSPAKAHVLSHVSRYRALAEENEEAIRVGEEALAMAERLGLDELRAHALDNVGIAKVNLGNSEGLTDIERSIEIALAAKSPEAGRAYNNLAAMTWFLGDLRRAAELFDQAVRVSDQFGSATTGRYSRIVRIQILFSRGEWSEGFRQADEFIAACEAGQSHYLENAIRGDRAGARLARGDVDGALDDMEKAIEHARRAKDPQALFGTLGRGVRVYADLGRVEEAKRLADELLAEGGGIGHAFSEIAWVADALDRVEEVREAMDRAQPETRWADAARAVLRGDFEEAADVYYEIGELEDEAHARLRAAQKLVRKRRRAEADRQLQKALSFYRSVGAMRYVREAESVLAASA